MHSFVHKQKPKPQATSPRFAKRGRLYINQSNGVMSILQSQRMTGNQTVQLLQRSNAEELKTRLTTTAPRRNTHDFSRIPVLSESPIHVQTKLTTDTLGDTYEREASRVAEQVMHMPEPGLQGVCARDSGYPRYGNVQDGQEQVQAKPLGSTSVADRSSRVGGVADRNALPNSVDGDALDPGVRVYFESRIGHDFSNVRVHAGPKAAQVAEMLDARALTVGRNILFARGEYAPHTRGGRTLLAHELVHVVQQSPRHHRGEYGLARTISRAAHGMIQRAVGYVGCRNATGRVREIVRDDPVGTVQAADARAIALLDRTIADLAYTRTQIRDGEPVAWPTIQDSVAAGLRDRFGLDPENREIWTTGRRHTRAGDPSIRLLLMRLRGARRLLAGGNIRYECLTSPPCPRMSGPDEVVLGADAFGECYGNTITLCEGFWRAERSVNDRARMLIHEAFHLFFCGTDAGRNMWNAHCIDQFIADVHGITIQEDYEGACG